MSEQDYEIYIDLRERLEKINEIVSKLLSEDGVFVTDLMKIEELSKL